VTIAHSWLNIDAGELDDEPEELYALADGVSIACGGHAGDDASMKRALGACIRNGCRAGAHPSFPDRAGFGRVAMAMPEDALAQSVEEQCARLLAHARDVGVVLSHVKPHGALYHSANRDGALARAVVGGAIAALGRAFTLVGPEKGELARVAKDERIAYAREAFADRGVRADGTLVPRGEPGAMIEEPSSAAARARELAGAVETICVHGDTKGAVAIARAVRATLDDARARLGDGAVRVALPATCDPREAFARVTSVSGVTDVVVTERHLAAYGVFDEADVARAIAASTGADRVAAAPRSHVVRARYDGADLGEVAEVLRLDPREVVRRHVASTYRVRMMGFLPGFAYLGPLDPSLVVPRRASPRARIEPFAIGIAAEYTGVYPFASPGGWNLIARALDVTLFDAERGATLALGDSVRFEEAP
jgi:UPF0271 protein